MATRGINGARLEVVERGAGEPIVFVHGSASDLRTWNTQLDEFGDRYRCIAYSRRYHWPNDPIPQDADYSMPQHVDDLLALLDALDARPAHLVGHSYGAFVALLAAIREPSVARSLVLAEPPVVTLFVSNKPRPTEILPLLLRRPRTAIALLGFAARGVGPATAAARRGDMDTVVRLFGRTVLGTEFFRRLSASRREQVAANTFRAEFTGSGFAPIDEADVRRLRIATLLVQGQHSPALFHRLLDRLQELLEDPDRVEIGGASHIMHEDNSAEYDAALRAFLAEHSAGASTATANDRFQPRAGSDE